MPKFQMTELVGYNTFTARVSAAAGDAALASVFNDITERGKPVKLAADSRYVLAVAGDRIESIIESVNAATSDGYSVAALRDCSGPGRFLKVTLAGSQAAGTGAITVGTYVLCGALVAKDTALSAPMNVVSATDQTAARAGAFAWRVVALGLANTAATGAVGTRALIERVA
jgi:hypothetical protein